MTVQDMAAANLYAEAQAIMGRLPRDIGKARRLGRLTAGQLTALERLNQIETMLPTTSPEWQRQREAHHAKAMERYYAEVAELHAAERARLAEAGLSIGQRVYAVQPGPFPWMAGKRLDGVIRLGKGGGAYVAVGRQRLCPFSNGFKPA